MAANGGTGGKRANSIISVQRVAEKLVFKLHGAGEADGTHTPVLEELQFEPAKCAEEIRTAAMWHGFEQRLRDLAAKPRDTKTGKSASPAEKFAAIRKVAEHYMTGAKEWRLAGGPGAGGRTESDDKQMLKAALAEYFPTVGKERTAEQIHEAVEGMEKGKVSALLAQSEIAAIVLRLREAKAIDQEIDAEELLAGI